MPSKYKNKFRTKTLRFQDYDYSQCGAYFVTICTKLKGNILGKIENEQFIEFQLSEIVRKCWLKLPSYYTNIVLDEFIIMPDHLHGIIMIFENQLNKGDDSVETIHELSLPQNIQNRRTMLLPKIIGRFKMQSAKKINEFQNTQGITFWQKDYFERIIRNEKELNNIQNYIINNPIKWGFEKDLVENLFM